jgi:hypothetical protein
VHLANVDHGGILTNDAAMSAEGRFFAAATFTSDVKVYEVCFERGGDFSRVNKAMDLKGHKGQVSHIHFFAPALAVSMSRSPFSLSFEDYT